MGIRGKGRRKCKGKPNDAVMPIKERNTFSTFRRNSGQVKMGGEETGKDKNWNTYRYFFYNWNFNCIPHKLFDPNCLDQY